MASSKGKLQKSTSRPKRHPRPKSKAHPKVTQKQGFQFFPRLPVELRLHIYTLAITGRIVSLLSLEVGQCSYLDFHSITGHSYPPPTVSELIPHGRFTRGPYAILDRIIARTTPVSLLEVCVESRQQVSKYYNYYLDSQGSAPSDIKLDADVVEDPRAERNWTSGHWVQTPRFLVKRKVAETVSTINPELDIVLLDPENVDILYIVEKWLSVDFKHRLRYLALTVQQCFMESAELTYGPCLLQFTGLEELILLVEPGIEEMQIALWPHPSRPTKFMIKQRLEFLVNEALSISVRMNPQWKRPTLRIVQDRETLEMEFK